jgi:hypothetical protein
MKYRKLRIAWSVAWGVVAVLLCVLWVWAYSRYIEANLNYYGNNLLTVSFLRGYLVILGKSNDSAFPSGIIVEPSNKEIQYFLDKLPMLFPGRFLDQFLAVKVPFWFAVALATVLAAAPWLPSRFSLRTLLLATTLVAVGLGVVVYTLSK